MIKNSLRNFGANAVYIFIAMGIVYLFLLIGIVFMFTGVVANLKGAITDVAALIKTSADGSSATVNEFLSYTLDELKSYGDAAEILKRVFDPEWLKSTLKGFFDTLNASTAGFDGQFTDIVNDFSKSLVAIIAATGVWCSVGIMIANYVTRFAIRRKTAKRGVKKFIIAHTLAPFVQSVVIVGAVILLAVIKLYGLLLFAAILLIVSGLSLTSAWLIHRDGKLKLRDVVTFKNILTHLAASLILLAINLVLAVLLILINPVIAVLIMIPVFIYTLNIADVNAEYFVCAEISKTQSAQEQPQ